MDQIVYDEFLHFGTNFIYFITILKIIINGPCGPCNPHFPSLVKNLGFATVVYN
jgi:hypothetical protein